VYEIARPGCRGAFWRANTHDELIAWIRLDRYQLAIFDKQGPTISLCVFLRGRDQFAAIVLLTRSSTAMRTATPFVTCWVMTEAGLSARLDSISMPRFIGPGCITIASAAASSRRFALKALCADAVIGEILLDTGNTLEALYALALNPQRHDNVCTADSFIEVVRQ